MDTFKKLWILTKGTRLVYICAIISTALASMFSLVTPLVIKFIVDIVISKQELESSYFTGVVEKVGGIDFIAQNLWICGLVIIFISIMEGIFSFLKGTLSQATSENLAKKLKDCLYDHLQKLPYDYHLKAQTGDLIQRCTSDVETIRKSVCIQLIDLARNIFLIIFAVYIMSSLNIKLTLISLIILPIILPVSYVFFNKIKDLFLYADEKEGEVSTVLQESLSGVRVVRAFGRQKFEIEKFEQKNKEYRKLIFRVMNYTAIYWAFSNVILKLQFVVTLILGITLTYKGVISLGTMILFVSYVNMLIVPVRQLGRLLSDMGKMFISMNRVYEILNTPIESDTDGAVEHNLKGDIVFENVFFEYEKGKRILNGMNFTVKSGETIAILGGTGSGKSSVIHLLLRLYDYTSGSIKINNKELREIRKSHLRKKIGIVLQEPFLYSKTLEENLKMAKDNVSKEEVVDATKTAHIHYVIEGFEKGYDTMIGEKGVTLSGGQKQRVAIARTLIKNSDILIFDDSLSAVDTETDAQIRKALKEKNNDITTFIISQRITTLMEADRIFILEKGTISDIGTHEQLICREGLYSRIWKIQNMLEEDLQKEGKI